MPLSYCGAGPLTRGGRPRPLSREPGILAFRANSGLGTAFGEGARPLGVWSWEVLSDIGRGRPAHLALNQILLCQLLELRGRHQLEADIERTEAPNVLLHLF